MRAQAQRECLEERCEEAGTRRTVKVDVVELELLECLVELLLDLVGAVGRVPELGGDEKLLALHDGRDDLLQRGTNLISARQTQARRSVGSGRTHLVLVLVDHSAVDVPISCTDRDLDLPPQRP